MKMFYSVKGVWRETGPELTQWLKTSLGTQVLFIVLLPTFTFHAGPHGPRMAAAVPWIRVTRAGRGAEKVVAALFFHQRRMQKPPAAFLLCPISGHLFLPTRLRKEAGGKGGTHLQRQCWCARSWASVSQEARNCRAG